MDNLINKKVIHKTFGKGKITEISRGLVTIVFDGCEQKFSYPSSFGKFLDFENPDDKKLIINDVEKEENKNKEIEKKKLLKKLDDERIYNYCINSNKKSNPSEEKIFNYKNINDFCDSFKESIIEEKEYLNKHGGKKQKLFDGKFIAKEKGKYVYAFESDSELHLPEGTDISIWTKGDKFLGNVISCEDFTIVFESRYDLGNIYSNIEISAEPWKLLEALIERIDDTVRFSNSSIVNDLVTKGIKNIDLKSAINKGQEKAVSMASSKPITFIWGPPGTGKTETLAKIAYSHIKSGRKVLMLSYSNVSVDGAIMRLYTKYPDLQPGEIVRYGYPRNKELLNHEYLTTYNLVVHKHSELLREQQSINNEIRSIKKTSKTDSKYVELQKRLTAIHNELKEEEKIAVENALFVATTVSKAFADSTIYKDKFDVVIFDEASMAYVPQIVFSASLADKHFICMGDFCQLPPIVQSSPNSILNVDIFNYCGIRRAVENRFGHNWLCMLDTQYRMHPEISSFSSSQMYGAQLKTASNMVVKRDNIVENYPMANMPLSLADLSGMMSVTSSTKDSSRVNVLSALVSFGLALKCVKDNSVGIITPYNAQSRLLYALNRDFIDENPTEKQIVCATVHQFQGSEKDVIIFDTVDCYRKPYPGVMLTSPKYNYANRLFNVALTRAKGKFILVTNKDYMQNSNLSKTLMLNKFIKKSEIERKIVQTAALKKEIENSNYSFYKIFSSLEGNEKFRKDILHAKKEIRIEIPQNMNNDISYIKEIEELFDDVHKKGIKVIIRTDDKQSLPKRLHKYAIENSFVYNPITIIDKKIVWFGEPLSKANFKVQNEIVPTRERPIIRIKGEHTANALYGFLNMNDNFDKANAFSAKEDSTDTFASYVAATCKCKECGSKMNLKRGKKNFFLGCSNYPKCRYTESVTVDLLNKFFYSKSREGLRCPKCGMSLIAKTGPYGVYVECGSLSRHKFKLDEF